MYQRSRFVLVPLTTEVGRYIGIGGRRSEVKRDDRDSRFGIVGKTDDRNDGGPQRQWNNESQRHVTNLENAFLRHDSAYDYDAVMVVVVYYYPAVTSDLERVLMWLRWLR